MFESRVRTINPDVNIEGFEFKKAAEGVGKNDLVCWGYLFYKSKFGAGVALVANDHTLYNLPTRYVAEFEKITEDERAIVMAGKPLEFREYETKSGQKTIIASIDGNDI